MVRRALHHHLENWKAKPHRKPLVLRGARQVGKSTLVRQFAKEAFEDLYEINLELRPEAADLIVGRPPEETLRLLGAHFRTDIRPGRGLLFLDEIQARPDLFAALRYLHEGLPDLHVIAAGSLLDFALQDAEFSVPVGRIEYAFLGPLTFYEFLAALGEERLIAFLRDCHLGTAVPQAIHTALMQRVKEYWVVGGMPEAAAVFADTRSFLPPDEIKRSIVLTYRDDFSKYPGRTNLDILRKVFQQVPRLVAKRAKFVEYTREASAKQVAKALDLLTQARVITPVTHTAAHGIPLGAEADEGLRKYLALDIGLQLSLCGLDAISVERSEDLLFVNNGALAEQFIGQELLATTPYYAEPALYYWERVKKNASAEVDFLVQHEAAIVPIEVKSGAAGRLKSLHVFLAEHDCRAAIRFWSGPPQKDTLDQGRELISLPLYLVQETPRLLSELKDR